MAFMETQWKDQDTSGALKRRFPSKTIFLVLFTPTMGIVISLIHHYIIEFDPWSWFEESFFLTKKKQKRTLVKPTCACLICVIALLFSLTHLSCRSASPLCLLFSFASCTKQPTTTFTRWCMIFTDMHAHLNHKIQSTASWKHHLVFVYINVQKALEICRAVVCIIHEYSRRKNISTLSLVSSFHHVVFCFAYAIEHNCLSETYVGQKFVVNHEYWMNTQDRSQGWRLGSYAKIIEFPLLFTLFN